MNKIKIGTILEDIRDGRIIQVVTNERNIRSDLTTIVLRGNFGNPLNVYGSSYNIWFTFGGSGIWKIVESPIRNKELSKIYTYEDNLVLPMFPYQWANPNNRVSDVINLEDNSVIRVNIKDCELYTIYNEEDSLEKPKVFYSKGDLVIVNENFIGMVNYDCSKVIVLKRLTDVAILVGSELPLRNIINIEKCIGKLNIEL